MEAMKIPSPRSGEPAINMPAALTIFIVLLLVIHAGRSLLPSLTEGRIVVDYGFVPARWSVVSGYASPEEVLREASRRDEADPDVNAVTVGLANYVTADTGSAWPSFISYSFLHGSWLHVGLNCIWLAAFGTPVVRRCGTIRSAILAAATSIGGALAFWIADPLGVFPMIGASGIVSGFMGAAAVFVFGEPLGSVAEDGRRGQGGLGALLQNRSALFFLGSWLVINLLTGLFGGALGLGGGAVAWQAHLGGLVTGLLLFPLLDPFRARQR